MTNRNEVPRAARQGTDDSVWNALCSFLSLPTIHSTFTASLFAFYLLLSIIRNGSLCVPLSLSFISPRQPQQPASWTTRSPRGHANSRLPPGCRTPTFDQCSSRTLTSSLSYYKMMAEFFSKFSFL